MARHQRMPPEEAGYTYAVEPAATNRLLANEEESIYEYMSGANKFCVYDCQGSKTTTTISKTELCPININS